MGRTVRREVETAVSPWQVWLAWTDPVHLSNWLLDSAEGELAVGQTVSWLLSGTSVPFQFVVRSLADERSLLVELRPSGQLIEIRIEGASGSCLVSITHSGFSDDDEGDVAYQEAIAAWQQRVNVLKLYLGHSFARPRQTIQMSSITTLTEYEISRYILDPSGHRKWLTLEGRLEPLRDTEIELWDGSKISSRILVASNDFMMFSWDEGKGFVLLTYRPSSSGKSEIGMSVSSWTDDPERLEAFYETLRVGLSKMLGFSGAEAASQGSKD